MTAGDASLMARHRDKFWGMLNLGVDILFANRHVPPHLMFTKPLCATSPGLHTDTKARTVEIT